MNPGRGSFAKTGRSIPTPFKQVDAEVDAMIAKKKARTENEMKAKADSTGVDKRMKDAGFGNIMSGEYGNKKANETRANLKGQFTYSMDKDKATGKYKKNWSNSPAKQVDAEVDKLIAKKKEREAKAKLEKARLEGEAARKKQESGVRIKLDNENENKARLDSTSVDNKMRGAGFGSIMSGEMGNKKANETRKAGTPYKYSYESVDKDKSTGKYKRLTKLSPAKQYIDPKEKEREQKRLNSMTEEQRARERKEGRPSDNPRPDRQKANQKAIEAKGPSRGSVQASKNPKSESNTIGGRSLERNGIRGDLQKTYKGSPTKQLGRQAVTKMGGKKTPAKMKSC